VPCSAFCKGALHCDCPSPLDHRNADKIVVLEHGRIFEVGKHTDLLARQALRSPVSANYGLSQNGAALLAENGATAPTQRA